MEKQKVILETPYAGNIHRHVSYARACLLDCLDRGEAPIASHLLYPQVLDDGDPHGRALGIAAGLAWRKSADRAVFYTDLGWSDGMEAAQSVYDREGIPYEVRRLFLDAYRFTYLLDRIEGVGRKHLDRLLRDGK